MERYSNKLKDLRVKIYADGANLAGMLDAYQHPYIKGFTTNPTLMRKAGITNYQSFAENLLKAIPDRPISLEVLSDEFSEMERQAHLIAGWGENVYVKIPVMNTRREPSYELVKRLSHSGIKVNVTAVMTLVQVNDILKRIVGGSPCYISVFAGRIADTGRDPLPIIGEMLTALRLLPNAELIWASPRELLNIFQADSLGCHIITVTNDILKKMELIGKDLNEYSLETVKMFYHDAKQAKYNLI
ncbi:transaldolase [Candidatus Parcubacteria bacterium]|nr:MAG: transaldolase [Candidatus Parcubacteria bacterium]